MKPTRLVQVSVIQCLGAHHAAVQLLRVRMCPHTLLCLAVRAAFAVKLGRWVTRAGQGGVQGVGRQWARKEVLVRAQVVPLSGGGAGQTEIWVVGASSTSDPGGCLLSSQAPDLNTEKKIVISF